MTKKPETKEETLEVIAGAMPLEALLTSPGFERNSALLLDPETLNPTTSPKLTRAVAQLAVSGAVKRAESKQRASATNTENAKAKRKGVTRKDLERVRQEYMHRMQTDEAWPEGRDHGWKEYALAPDRLPVRITRKTLDARWKGK